MRTIQVFLTLLLSALALYGQALTLRDPAFIAATTRASSGQTLTVTNGLVHWLKADSVTNTVNGSAVVFWPDDSPSTSKPVSWNGTPTTEPTYKVNAQNGLPAVDFDGINDALVSNATATPSNTCSMFIAFRQRTTAGFHGIYIVGNAAGFGLVNNVGARSVLHRAVATCDDGNCATNAEVWASVRTAVPLESMWVNSTNVTVSNSGSACSAPDANITVGTFAGLYLDGQIYEILLYDRPVNSTERGLVTTYLMTKWFITQ